MCCANSTPTPITVRWETCQEQLHLFGDRERIFLKVERILQAEDKNGKKALVDLNLKGLTFLFYPDKPHPLFGSLTPIRNQSMAANQAEENVKNQNSRR